MKEKEVAKTLEHIWNLSIDCPQCNAKFTIGKRIDAKWNAIIPAVKALRELAESLGIIGSDLLA